MSEVAALSGQAVPAPAVGAKSGKAGVAQGAFAALIALVGRGGETPGKTGEGPAAQGADSTVPRDPAAITDSSAQPISPEARPAWLPEGAETVPGRAGKAAGVTIEAASAVVGPLPRVATAAPSPAEGAESAPAAVGVAGTGDAPPRLVAGADVGATMPEETAASDDGEARPATGKQRRTSDPLAENAAALVAQATVSTPAAQLAAASPAAQAASQSTAALSGDVSVVASGGVEPGLSAIEAGKVGPAADRTADAGKPASATVLVDARFAPSGGQGEAGDRQEAPRDRRGDAKDAVALPAESAKEGSTALRDIMNSLPPVLQAQLDAASLAQAQSAPPLVLVPTTAPLMITPSTGAQLGDRMIDMSVQGQWIDRMAQEIATLTEGTGHSRFQLSPPNLGRIQVDLWHGEEATHVRLLTETDEAARRLREGQGSLETHARLAALSLGSVTVEKSNAPLESNRDQNNAQNPRQNPDMNGQGQQQAADERGAARGTVNQSGLAAVMGQERPAETTAEAAPARAADPRVRFA